MLSAAILLECSDQGRALAAADAEPLDLARGRELAAEIVARRVGRGERPAGYKIGFTNRAIWPLYGVSQPIWGRVYESTLTRLTQPSGQLSIGRFCEPRIEPELVFGIGRAPRSAALSDLLAAIDWYAHGFEIVHSIFPAWKFTAAQAFAAQGLHGALVLGPVRPIDELPDPVAQLAALRLSLHCNGALLASGRGANVLDGPVQALAHLVSELAALGVALRAGEVVTTGTLTDAMPIRPGQHWHTVLGDTRLAGLSLHV